MQYTSNMSRLPVLIAFEWDKGNRDKNWIKHRVYFKEAEEVFLNKPLKVYPDVKHSKEEQRFVAYGTTNKYRKLAVVFTIRNNNIRIISVRNQNQKERRAYDKKETD